MIYMINLMKEINQIFFFLLYSPPHFRLMILEDGTLRITNISKSDEGSYTCVARNHFGASSSTGALLVKGASSCLSTYFFLLCKTGV